MRFGANRIPNRSQDNGAVFSEIPKTPRIVRGYNELAAFTPTNPSYTFGLIKCVDGFYYFGGMSIAILLQNRDPFIYKYDPVNNKIVQKIPIRMGFSGFTDSHRLPCIASDGDGNIWVVAEQMITGGGTSAHGSPINVYKTSTPGDLSTLTLVKTFTGKFSYPGIIISGTKAFICARGTTGTVTFIRGEYWYSNCPDISAPGTWDAMTQLYNSSDEDTQVAYCWMQYDYTTDNIHIILNERNNTLNGWTFVAHIRGEFGSHVWENQAGTFSKNVSSSGALTRTEWVTNCMIFESTSYGTININHEGGMCKSNGDLKILVSVQTATGNTYLGNPETELDELRWYYWTGSAWAFENVDLPASPVIFYWAYNRYWQALNNDTIYDEIIFIDPTSSTKNVYIKRSTDNFATETDRLIVNGSSAYVGYRLGAITMNSEDESDRVILLTNTRGNNLEIDAETRLDFSDLLVVFPYTFSKYAAI